MHAGFTILPHPSDLGIEAHGANLAEAFSQAGQGMMSVILDLASVGCRERVRISLDAADAQQLLVRWLGEILFQYDANGFLTKEIVVEEFSASRIVALLNGEYLDRSRHRTQLDVKAVTYHQIEVSGGPDGGRVRVFLDI